MSRKEKLLKKLLSKPKDFKWSELRTLLKSYGYEEKQGSGARVKFIHTEPRNLITLHKPHPDDKLLLYVIDIVIDGLKDIGVLNGNV